MKKPYFQKKYKSYLNIILKDIISIAYLPQKINQRKRVDDYEIALVVSVKDDNSTILTLVDCKTKRVILLKPTLNIRLKSMKNL